jgi:hypothetical protein
MKEMILRNLRSRFPKENAIYLAVFHSPNYNLIISASLSLDRMFERLWAYLGETGGSEEWTWLGHDDPNEFRIESKAHLGGLVNPYILIFGRELD